MADFIRTFYRISIVDTGFSTTAPNDGFIDNTEVWNEAAFDPKNGATLGTHIPSTIVDGKEKARGYFRWTQLQRNLGEGAVINYFGSVDDAQSTDGTITAVPDQIDFTVGYDKQPAEIITYDENDGVTLLTGVDAVKRMAARVFVFDFNTSLEWYNPVLDVDNNPAGVQITSESVDAPAPGASLAARITDAETNITVTKVANVE